MKNAEYIYGKKKLREIDRRLRHLGNRLEKLEVIRTTPLNKNKVFFGAWVKLLDENDSEIIYRIVGPDEFDMHPQYISMDSPVAKCLLKKHKQEDIIVKTPSGIFEYYIDDISYGLTPSW